MDRIRNVINGLDVYLYDKNFIVDEVDSSDQIAYVERLPDKSNDHCVAPIPKARYRVQDGLHIVVDVCSEEGYIDTFFRFKMDSDPREKRIVEATMVPHSKVMCEFFPDFFIKELYSPFFPEKEDEQMLRGYRFAPWENMGDEDVVNSLGLAIDYTSFVIQLNAHMYKSRIESDTD